MRTLNRAVIDISVCSIALLVLVGCGNLVNPPARLGMVKDPDTGLQFGSVVQRNLVTDSSFYRNRRIKVRVRNTSGDRAFDLHEFKARLEDAYAGAGYQPTGTDDFGLLLDVNVRYSGQAQTNLANEFSFLGASAGGLAGASHSGDVATASGIVAGATWRQRLGLSRGRRSGESSAATLPTTPISSSRM